MGGWFRKEIKTVADLKGLKFRIGGFAGLVLAKLGVVPQQIAGGDIYPALEKGTIDAAEWVGPVRRREARLQQGRQVLLLSRAGGKAARRCTCSSTEEVGRAAQVTRRRCDAAAPRPTSWMLAKYDAQNPPALRRLVAGGTQLRPFPNDVMEACYKAADGVYAETPAKNAKFKKIYDDRRRSSATSSSSGSGSPKTPSTTSCSTSQSSAPAKK